MRTFLPVLVCTLAFAVSAPAQTAPAATKAKATTGVAGKATPAPPAKKAPEPKIEGMEISRGELGYLGVQIVGASFKINFYDKKKAPIAPDVVRALLRWDPKNKPGQERLVLNVGEDGKSLTAGRAVRPPYNFKLFITLMKKSETGEDKAVETHVIDFKA
ncbi:MAG: hypothetical protein JNL92_13225 [Opitutaceae bacterium]|nr:hypothetical protein [Opitutaceae bacterium]